jgi:hypothetical protein
VFAFAELFTTPKIKENNRVEVRAANTGTRRDFLFRNLARTLATPKLGIDALGMNDLCLSFRNE